MVSTTIFAKQEGQILTLDTLNFNTDSIYLLLWDLFYKRFFGYQQPESPTCQAGDEVQDAQG